MRTDLSTAEEEDPPIRASSRARAGTGALGSRGEAAAAAAAMPQPGVPPRPGPRCRARPLPRAPRSPPHRQGSGNPPARFFCAVSAKLRGSWSFCSTIYRLRQHCEKEKAERWGREKPQHTTSVRSAPAARPPPASRSPPPPPPCPGQSAANPVTCPPGKTSSPGLRAAHQAPWRRPPSSAVRLARGLQPVTQASRTAWAPAP